MGGGIRPFLCHQRTVRPEGTDPATRRKRVLGRDELRAVLPILRQSKRPHAAAMLFTLLTVARLEEVCGTPWREIDLLAATWTLPPERTKNEEPHIIPLSRQAVELLRRIGPGEPDALVFTGERGAPLGNWDRARKAIRAKSGTRGAALPRPAAHQHDPDGGNGLSAAHLRSRA